MLSLTLDTESFAARRRKAQTDLEARLVPAVREALETDTWDDVLDLAADLLAQEYTEESGDDLTRSTSGWRGRIEAALERGDHTSSHSVNSIALWLATAVLTEATIMAAIDDEDDLFLEWVDMGDTRVREAHQEVSGQVRPAGEPFDVDGVEMSGPGDVTAPTELWINCRCTLRPTLASAFTITAAGGIVEPTSTDMGIPVHGVLAPEGVWSGDKRKFAEGALTTRPLPLPFTWQKFSDDGHKGNVTVAMIEDVFTADGLMYWEGRQVVSVPESDEFIGLVAEFGKFGTSVDADMSTFEVDEDEEGVVFTSARVSSACAVPIPAFSEAYIALGPLPEEIRKKRPVPDGEEAPKPPEADVPDEEMLKPADQIPTDEDGAPVAEEDRDPKKRKGIAPAAALAAAAGTAEFVDVSPGKTEDGPGWLTNPVDTDRIRDYWVRGPGAAKIGWGTPGDFNRCRINVAEYVKPQHLNGYCANRHYDALGFWPGRPVAGDTTAFAAEALQLEDQHAAPAVSLVASIGHKAPAAWFTMPEPDEPTPFTVTDSGQVYGHIATWDACHLNSEMAGLCTSPPRTMSDYAYFLNSGVVLTDDGNQVPVGQITLGGGHAGPNLSMRAALAHYDSTSTVVCDVTITDGEHGPWVCGWVRPGTSAEMVTAMRASAVSGDWREVNGNLELIAVLAVNVPGFGIPRTRVGVRNREQVSLVASGILAPSEESREQVVADLEQQGIDYDTLAAKIAAEMAATEQRKAFLASLELEEVD